MYTRQTAIGLSRLFYGSSDPSLATEDVRNLLRVELGQLWQKIISFRSGNRCKGFRKMARADFGKPVVHHDSVVHIYCPI